MTGIIPVIAAALSTAATSALAYVSLPIAVRILAKDNLFFTLAEEMKGLIVVRGGSFDSAILASKDFHLNDRRSPQFNPRRAEWEVLPNTGEESDTRSWILQKAGAYYVGPPWLLELYRYQFIWKEMGTTVPRKEMTKYWFANDFVYLMEAEDLNTSENLPVSIKYSLTVRITNPYKALFDINDWLLKVQTLTVPIIREIAANHTWNQLRGLDDEKDPRKTFNALITSLSQALPGENANPNEPDATGTAGHYGVTIERAGFQDPQLIGEFAGANESASTALYLAARQGEARVITSKADAEVQVNLGTAEAQVTERKGTAEANALSSVLEVASQHPELAAIRMKTAAIATPGEGKVVVDLGATLGSLVEPLLKRKA